MGEIPLENFTGLNTSAKLKMLPSAFIDGKNFLIDTDGSVGKSWGSQLIYDGHDLKGIQSIFFHQQISTLLFLLGMDNSTDVVKMMVNDGSWREIGEGIFSESDFVWNHSYKNDPYMFFGDKAAYYDVSMDGHTFPDEDSTATELGTGKLIDSSASFWSLGVTKWMQVRNVTQNKYFDILEVLDDNTIIADITSPSDEFAVDDEYRFYHHGFVDLDQINKSWYLSHGGAEANYQKIYGFSPLIHFNALWIAGMDAYRNSVLRTRAFTNIFYVTGIGGLPDINYISVGGDDSVSGATDDYITGMKEWREEVFVAKRFSCHRIVGQVTNYRSIVVNPKVGCRYPESMQVTKRGIIFLSDKRDGFWIYNGGMENISRPFIDEFLSDIRENFIVRSGYIFNRYYIISIGPRTLVYDDDMKSWTIVDKSYAGFAEDSVNTIAVSNDYETATVEVSDPERPGEVQDVLQLTPTESNLFSFDLSGSFEKDAEGLNGSDLPFQVTTPFFDCGTKGRRKVFDTLVLQVDSGEPLITIDLNIDGHVYKDLRSAVDPNPTWDRGIYYENDYATKPFHTLYFDLSGTQMGIMASLTIKCSSKNEFKIFGGILGFRFTGKKKEENE